MALFVGIGATGLVAAGPSGGLAAGGVTTGAGVGVGSGVAGVPVVGADAGGVVADFPLPAGADWTAAVDEVTGDG